MKLKFNCTNEVTIIKKVQVQTTTTIFSFIQALQPHPSFPQKENSKDKLYLNYRNFEILVMYKM